MTAVVKSRDLAWWEPHLFREIAWAGQVLLRGKATIAGEVLLLDGGAMDMIAAGIEPGDVVVVGELTCEVVEVRGEEELRVSLVRARGDDRIRLVGDVSAADAWIPTFAPQVALACGRVARLIGADVSTVVNSADCADLVALAALEIIAHAAGAAGGPDHPWSRRAVWYAARLREDVDRAVLEFDRDGDGAADVRRRARSGLVARG